MAANGRWNDEGSVLAMVVLAMGVLAALSVAGFESARLALQASRAQSAAAVALFAADEGLAAYLAGFGPETGSSVLDVPPGRALVDARQLLALVDGTRLVAVSSRGEASPGVAHATGRAVAVVAHLDDLGVRRAVSGSWREEF